MREEPRLGEILVQAGVIDEFQLSAALEEQQRRGHRLGMTLVQLGFLAEPDLVRALASQLQIPIVRLDGKGVDREILELVPQDLAEKHNVLPLFIKNLEAGRELCLGMENPCDRLALEDIARHAGMAVAPVIVAASELAMAIDRLSREVGSAPADALGEELDDITESLAPRLLAPLLAPLQKLEERDKPVKPVNPGEADTRIILQALTQLLIESDLIDRDVLMRRIAKLEASKG